MTRASARGFTHIELMAAVAIITILASVAIPQFIKVGARSRQSEVKNNLKGYFTSSRAYFAEQGTFICGTCGFTPDAPNRYRYDFGNGQVINPDPKVTSEVCTYSGRNAPGQSGSTFVAIASANIDSDPTCDSWAVNQENNLINEVNDVDN